MRALWGHEPPSAWSWPLILQLCVKWEAGQLWQLPLRHSCSLFLLTLASAEAQRSTWQLSILWMWVSHNNFPPPPHPPVQWERVKRWPLMFLQGFRYGLNLNAGFNSFFHEYYRSKIRSERTLSWLLFNNHMHVKQYKKVMPLVSALHISHIEALSIYLSR